MATWVKRYSLTLVILLALDALWLGVIAPSFYRAQIGFLMAASPNWSAAGAFYQLFRRTGRLCHLARHRGRHAESGRLARRFLWLDRLRHL